MVHASTVMVNGHAVVLFGASGSGKSSTALMLMSLGGALVADDRTVLTREATSLIARCPETIRGRIEARGVGIMRAPTIESAPVSLFVDMNQLETERLPQARQVTVFGLQRPLLHKVERGYFPAALMQCLSHGIDGE